MKCFFSCLLLCLSFESYSQKTSSEFSLDVLHFQNIERSLIPLKNAGIGLRGAYNLEKREEKGLRSLQISIAAANPKTIVESRNRSLVGNLSASFDRQFNINRTDFYVGYVALISYRNGFYKAIDQSHLYWTNFFGGGFAASYVKPLNQSSEISVSLKLPLIGLGSRSPEDRLYKVDDPSVANLLKINHSDIRFHTFNSYFQPVAEVEYRRQFAKNWELGLFLRQEYLSTQKNEGSHYKEIQNGCGIKFILIH